ncbi:MAG: GNAT family N-acetyltransferase [Pseudomonadota bacterium]
MDYALRLYRDDDAERLAKIMRAAILSIGPRAYTAEQVAAWAGRAPGGERFRTRVAEGAMIFVAADHSNEAVAYSLLEVDQAQEGHLDHLYCHPDHTRLGLAEKLLASAEQHARSVGVTRLYTEASELARPAFERAGYVVEHRRDFEIDSVPIHNYAMEKRLA